MEPEDLKRAVGRRLADPDPAHPALKVRVDLIHDGRRPEIGGAVEDPHPTPAPHPPPARRSRRENVADSVPCPPSWPGFRRAFTGLDRTAGGKFREGLFLAGGLLGD